MLGGGCSSGDKAATDIVSSRSYRGHESDVDITNFVNVYQATVGTRLDDCQTCHKSATLTEADGGNQVTKNPCDYCHLIQTPETGYIEALPTTPRDTLNPYGLDYDNAGRSRDGLQAIAANDSDGDGYANDAEIADFKYPGDPNSHPGQQTVPMRVFSKAELQAVSPMSEFLLVNSTRQQFDFYANYTGPKLHDLLVAAGVDPTDPAIKGLTLIAPDGFLQDVSIAAVNQQRPAGVFYGGLNVDTLGSACGFVQYPDPLPAGVSDGAPVPGEQWLLLAYERDGAPMDPSVLDVTTAKLEGEGPFRLIVPQGTPGAPDRGASNSPTSCGDGHDFDQTADHNAGEMARGVIAVRVNPIPEGYEDFDYRNGGWAYIANETVVVYGHGVQVP